MFKSIMTARQRIGSARVSREAFGALGHSVTEETGQPHFVQHRLEKVVVLTECPKRLSIMRKLMISFGKFTLHFQERIICGTRFKDLK